MMMKYWYMDIRVDNSTAIIFDLDDTLYNEIEFLKSAYLAIAQNLEPINWKALLAKMISRYRNRMDVFGWLTEQFPVSKEELLFSYRTHVPVIRPFDGVMEACGRIREKGGRMGILTDGRSVTQRNKIMALGLSEVMDYVGISEELGSEKPNPDNFRHMEAHFKLDKYYYLGDNLKKDFIVPNALGWTTIGIIDNGLNIHYDQYLYWKETHLPGEFISSFKELRIN